MFYGIETVVRDSPVSITLKSKTGSGEKLERQFAQIVFEARTLSIMDRFDYETETRVAADQPPLKGFIEEDQAIEKNDIKPIFTITKSTFGPLIQSPLTTEDQLYWFKDDKFGGEFTNVSLCVYRVADKPGAILHVWNATRDGEPTTFMLVLLLSESEFDRLHRTIWFAKGPCWLRIVVSVICYQEPAEAALNESFPDNLVFEADTHNPAKLVALSIHQKTSTQVEKPPVEDEETDEQIDVGETIDANTVAIRQLQATTRLQTTMKKMHDMIWWIGAGLGVLIMVMLFWRR